MNTFFTEVRQTLVPRCDAKHGSLPALLVAMFVIALVGSLLIFPVSIVSLLVIALIAIAGIAVTTRVLSMSDPAWIRVS